MQKKEGRSRKEEREGGHSKAKLRNRKQHVIENKR